MANIAQLLTEHMEIWTGAETEKKSGRGRVSGNGSSVYGVKKLRELIYELASIGKLVKGELNCNTKLLGQVSEFIMGQAPPGAECNFQGLGEPFVKTGEFGEIYPEIREWTTKPLKFAKKGDVLICVVGATIGKLNLGIDCSIGRSVAAIRPTEEIDTKYLYYMLMPFTIKLRTNSRGSAQGVIGKAELSLVKIRVPSKSEQHRIVAKVEELMALCDQLEQQHGNAQQAHETLVSQLLATLTRSQNAAEFNANWQRIYAHFNLLFTTEASIDALKQTLLQLAVMGKLVPQDPDDEPASELLKRIQAEKAKLIAERKLKKEKPLTPITDEEKPFELPQGWEWVRFSEFVLSIISGGTPSKNKAEYWNGSIPWASVKDLNVEKYLTETQDYITEEGLLAGSKLADKGDLIICTRMGLGKIAIAAMNVAINQDLKALKLTSHLNVDYFINFYSTLKISGSGMTVAGIRQEELLGYCVPLPPLAEQHRIVAKVDALMALCDQLKTRLQQAGQQQQAIADALVARAVQ